MKIYWRPFNVKKLKWKFYMVREVVFMNCCYSWSFIKLLLWSAWPPSINESVDSNQSPKIILSQRLNHCKWNLYWVATSIKCPCHILAILTRVLLSPLTRGQPFDFWSGGRGGGSWYGRFQKKISCRLIFSRGKNLAGKYLGKKYLALKKVTLIGRYKTQVTGHRAQVTGHRSQVTGHRAQVIGHRKRSKNS